MYVVYVNGIFFPSYPQISTGQGGQEAVTWLLQSLVGEESQHHQCIAHQGQQDQQTKDNACTKCHIKSRMQQSLCYIKILWVTSILKKYKCYIKSFCRKSHVIFCPYKIKVDFLFIHSDYIYRIIKQTSKRSKELLPISHSNSNRVSNQLHSLNENYL